MGERLRGAEAISGDASPLGDAASHGAAPGHAPQHLVGAAAVRCRRVVRSGIISWGLVGAALKKRETPAASALLRDRPPNVELRQKRQAWRAENTRAALGKTGGPLRACR
jgi:hypothetical protein